MQCCRGVYCVNSGAVLERSHLYQIKLSSPILNSYVVLKSVASISELKRIPCQKFVVFPTALVVLINNICSTLKNLFYLSP